MKLLEHEAKSLLREYSIPLPRSELLTKATEPSFLPSVLKSQVPTGGRGKLGGIRVAKTAEEAKATTKELFSLSIKGHTPSAILAEEMIDIQRELYLSLLIDQSAVEIQLVAHQKGGVEVEENEQESFLKVSLATTSHDETGERLAEYYDLPSQSFALQDLIERLHDCFVKNDATLIEINPLILTADDKLVAGDCKMTVDDAALFRHRDWQFEDTPSETNFVTLDEQGVVATIANGAGLAMATVDAVADTGLTAANFLDIGGGASKDSVLVAFEKIMEYPAVSAIVINIFAGITRCDEVAKAIVAARSDISNLPPLYIRLAGTNFEIAEGILAAEEITLYEDLPACLRALQKDQK